VSSIERDVRAGLNEVFVEPATDRNRRMPATLLEPVERFVFDASRKRFVAVVLMLAFAKTGVWYMPNTGMSRWIALDPFANPFSNPDAHYLYWNWLSPFLAWLVGANGIATFVLFHLAFAVAFTSLFTWTIFRRLPERQARIAFLIFVSIPASGTVYYWIGMDAVVLFLMLVALVYPKPPVVPLIAGIALGLQHFEQGLVAGGALLVAIVTSSRMRLTAPYSPGFAIAWIVGTIAGKALLTLLFARWGVIVNTGRLTLFGHEFQTLLLEAAFHFQVILWSMLGVGWLVLLGYVDRLRREALPLVCGLLVCLPFLVLAQDETRVIAIITFPLLAGYWFFNEEALARVSGRDASFLFVAWLVVPWNWTWLGIPRWSALPYDVYWILDKVFGPFLWIRIDEFRLFP